MRRLPALCLLALALPGLATAAVTTTAMPVCRSSASAAPVALVERFLPADCAGCWRGRDTAPAGALVIDWIVPAAAHNDDAPLGPAAVREAGDRLAALGAAAPAGATTRHTSRIRRDAALALTVAHGLVLGGYVGASLYLQLRPGARPAWPLTGWLLMVEDLPAGTEGSPVARRLARNLLTVRWDGPAPTPLTEARPMNVPDNLKADRLAFIGWVTDATGRTVAATQARCGR